VYNSHDLGSFTIILALAFHCALQAQQPAADPWTFTPQNYQDLVKGGSGFSYDPDSDWFPQELKDNLTATLKHVLDPSLKPPSISEISVKDFFHGHVVCPLPCSGEQTKALTTFYAAERAARKEIAGMESFFPTQDNLAKWKQIVKQDEQNAAILLKACLQKGCGIVYHTFEYNTPQGMQPGDPRRNIFTPNGKDAKPEHFKPPKEDNASSFLDKYCFIANFGFVIDKNGKIHVTTGSGSELGTVTGVVPK